jgi:hypothetical protein
MDSGKQTVQIVKENVRIAHMYTPEIGAVFHN